MYRVNTVFVRETMGVGFFLSIFEQFWPKKGGGGEKNLSKKLVGPSAKISKYHHKYGIQIFPKNVCCLRYS